MKNEDRIKMTIREAIEELKYIFSDIFISRDEAPKELLLAIKALEKQEPKKPIKIN